MSFLFVIYKKKSFYEVHRQEIINQKAAKQSKFIIFYLRRSSLNEANSIKQLEREFIDHKSKKLLVIKKNGQLLEFPN